MFRKKKYHRVGRCSRTGEFIETLTAFLRVAVVKMIQPYQFWE